VKIQDKVIEEIKKEKIELQMNLDKAVLNRKNQDEYFLKTQLYKNLMDQGAELLK
jgi:hypothetical protein